MKRVVLAAGKGAGQCEDDELEGVEGRGRTRSCILDVRVDDVEVVHLGALERADGEPLDVVGCFSRRLRRRVDEDDVDAWIPFGEVAATLTNALRTGSSPRSQQRRAVRRGGQRGERGRHTCSWL